MSRTKAALALLELAKPAGTRLSLKALGYLPRGLLLASIRARCQAVGLDQETLLCRALGRYKMLLDRADRGFAPHLLLDGYWELNSTRFLLRNLRRGQVAWDVGANLGYFTLLMADLVGPGGTVLAMEPNPRMAELCRRTLELNGFHARCRLEQAAAADFPGRLRFRDLPGDPKNAHVIPAGTPRDAVLGEYEVRGLPLDELGERADMLKIDVEGAEEAVWGGMQRLLGRNPGITVLMEFNPLRLGDPGALLRDIAGRFPLAEVEPDGGVAPLAAEAVLGRQVDTMLVLRRP